MPGRFDRATIPCAQVRFPLESRAVAKRSCRRVRARAAPKAQPARKRSGTRTAGTGELWRVAHAGPPKGSGTGIDPVPNLSGFRTEGRRAWWPAALFLRPSRLRVSRMGRRTPLYDLHVAAGARMVDFGGWDMPVAYGSQIEEHHAVRRDAGMFDVSHMCAVDLRGAGVRPLLLRCSPTTSAASTAPGKALYSCMLRPDGGVIDDLIACFIDETLVPAGRQRRHRRQGPRLDQGAREADRRRGRAAARPRDDRRAGTECAREGDAASCRRPVARRAAALGNFFGAACDEWFVSRTGYTGEDGFEIALPAEVASRPLAGAASRGRRALRARRARYAAARGRHESLRQRHGRNGFAARIGPRLDRGARRQRATSSARRRSRSSAPRARRASSRGSFCSERGVLRSHQKVFAGAAGDGRGDERDVLADARALDRPRAPAGCGRWQRRGRHPRQAHACAHRQAAVRAERQGHDRTLDSENRMSQYPADLRYTKSHEWLRTLPDGSDRDRHHRSRAAVARRPGVRRGARSRPPRSPPGDACAVVESVKAASDVYSPIAGEVTAGNPKLATEPELINRDPYGEGWILRVKPAGGARPRRRSMPRPTKPWSPPGAETAVPYIPHTPEDVRAMLDRIGVGSHRRPVRRDPAGAARSMRCPACPRRCPRWMSPGSPASARRRTACRSTSSARAPTSTTSPRRSGRS